MQNSSYPGDEAAAEILRRADCAYTVGSLRALLAGVLMGRATVAPKVVLDEIEFGAIDQPHFGDKKLAEDFLGTFFGLWNQIADHRDPARPFSFSQPSPSWRADDAAEWFEFTELRESEIGDFLVGLDLSKTPSLVELAKRGDKDTANYLPHLLSRHLGQLENERLKLQREKSVDASPLRDIINAIDSDVKKYHRQFTEKMLLLQPGVRSATKPVARAAPKVGRNDPCPCGSGKKFKQCCLE